MTKHMRLKPFSRRELARLNRQHEQWRKRPDVARLLKAIRESERITGADRAIVINAR